MGPNASVLLVLLSDILLGLANGGFGEACLTYSGYIHCISALEPPPKGGVEKVGLSTRKGAIQHAII